MGARTAERAAPAAPEWSLALFDEWRLRRDRTDVPVRRREQRLLALLAVQGGRPRGYLAGMLWPESTERRATGNLRAAVWQVDRAAPGLLAHDRSRLRLHPGTSVDVDDFLMYAGLICGAERRGGRTDRSTCKAALSHLLAGELLPGWYDDWVIFERSRLQQLRLRALELLAELACGAGDLTTALIAASAAVAVEPLRESAHRALIRAHIRSGNYHEALAVYHAFRARTVAELSVAPSHQLDVLVRPLLDQQSTALRARHPQPLPT